MEISPKYGVKRVEPERQLGYKEYEFKGYIFRMILKMIISIELKRGRLLLVLILIQICSIVIAKSQAGVPQHSSDPSEEYYNFGVNSRYNLDMFNKFNFAEIDYLHENDFKSELQNSVSIGLTLEKVRTTSRGKKDLSINHNLFLISSKTIWRTNNYHLKNSDTNQIIENIPSRMDAKFTYQLLSYEINFSGRMFDDKNYHFFMGLTASIPINRNLSVKVYPDSMENIQLIETDKIKVKDGKYLQVDDFTNTNFSWFVFGLNIGVMYEWSFELVNNKKFEREREMIIQPYVLFHTEVPNLLNSNSSWVNTFSTGIYVMISID